MSIVVAHDATHEFINHLPGGQAAGYTTGSPSIRWTNADWAAHPGAVRIDQDFSASDPSADVLDVENGAATFSDCPRWAKQAMADFIADVRHGQRTPAIYCSASSVTSVANALVNGGVKSGVGLWVASWGIGEAAALSMLASAGGPFPVIGVQYNNGEFFDYDLFSGAWLNDVSGNEAHNPVGGLHVVDRGYTHVTLSWDAAKNADAYTVHAYWRGKNVRSYTVATASCRVRSLLPAHTYTFKVRAHPGASVGSDAEIKSTTRPA